MTTPYKFHIFIVRKLNKKQKTKKMKKILVVFTILSTMILVSCGGKSVETVATDSTAVDSTAVVVDTVAVEVGGGAEVVEVEAAQGEAVK